jgi:hypothetical protein
MPAGRNLLHWTVLKGSDKMLEDCLGWLDRLQVASGEPGPSERAPNHDSGPLRAVLLLNDCLGDTPMHLAAKCNAAMKVYLMTKLDPWATMWTRLGRFTSAFSFAAMELDRCTTRLKTSEVSSRADSNRVCFERS